MKPKSIKPIQTWLYYTPCFRNTPDLSVYFGNNKTGIPLFFNFETNHFELNINPHGDKKGIPIDKVDFSSEESTFSFEVIVNGQYKKYVVYALFESDKTLFRLLEQLHGKGISTNAINLTDNALRLGLKEGMLMEFATTNYDESGSIIPLAGIDIRIQEFNSDGKPDNSENLLRTLPIVAEKFVFREKKGHLFHEIDKLYFIEKYLVVESKDKSFKSLFQTVPIIFDAVTKLIEVRQPYVKNFKNDK